MLKKDEVIYFLTSQPADFSALKMFKLKCYLIFKNQLPGYQKMPNTLYNV